MTAQKGSDILLKIHNGTSFETVAGLRTKNITLNAEQVDITNSESANKWRELLAGAGIKSASLSGAGVFLDDASEETVRAEFFNQAHVDWQIVLPSFAQLEGAFQVTALAYAGEHNGEMTYDISLESAGEITSTAV